MSVEERFNRKCSALFAILKDFGEAHVVWSKLDFHVLSIKTFSNLFSSILFVPDDETYIDSNLNRALIVTLAWISTNGIL